IRCVDHHSRHQKSNNGRLPWLKSQKMILLLIFQLYMEWHHKWDLPLHVHRVLDKCMDHQKGQGVQLAHLHHLLNLHKSCAADECLANKPKVGVQRSWVWGHYKIYQNGERAMCKHCKISNYKIGGKKHGTSNLQNHLDKCQKYKSEMDKEARAAGQQTLDFQPCKPGEEPQLVGVSFSQDGCRRALIKFIIKKFLKRG
ncbi:hypothetical protein MKW98_029037, partial [Papaver atlanticum]